MTQCLICVALASEARPIIDRFNLKAKPQSRYRCYSNERITLIESGIGKLNAASATAATLNELSLHSSPPVCINIGIVGADKELGDLLCAESIADQASGKKWYPQQTWNPVAETIALHTVDTPQTQYSANTAYDMEAAGIVNSAIRFMTLEFIQCIKVVSDNPHHCISGVSPKIPSELIEQHCESIELAVDRLLDLRRSLPETSAITDFMQVLELRFRFSATQRPLLLTTLHQYRSRLNHLPSAEQLTSLKNAQALIQFLQSNIASAPRLY